MSEPPEPSVSAPWGGWRAVVALLTLSALLPQIVWAVCAPGSPAPTHALSILKERPHDPTAYTQGLIFFDGTLFESTGRYGRSSIRRVSLHDGAVLHSARLPTHWFGEGLAAGTQGLWQLTWKRGLALLWDPVTLRLKARAAYTGEGWGLARSGAHLFMSDGSHVIRRLDPGNFREQDRFEVCNDGEPVRWLNELEMVRGLLWANVWQRDHIARIDPATGRVHSWLDATTLRRRQPKTAEVLNGIAFDAAKGEIWLTGKLWDRMYRVAVQSRKRRVKSP